MVKTVTLEGPQQAAPVALYGMVKVCKREDVIIKVVGFDRYWAFFMEAANALEPELPELATLIPSLAFNSNERGKLSFHLSLDMGKLAEEETEDLVSWSRKLPEDGGYLYQQTAQLMKWS